MTKPNPCPICDHEAICYRYGAGQGPFSRVSCGNGDCQASGPRRKKEDDAIEEWNRLIAVRQSDLPG